MDNTDPPERPDRICHQCLHGGNWKVPPTQWGITEEQFSWVIDQCSTDSRWPDLVRNVDYKTPDHVNAYQLSANYVKPWTSGTGSSLALLLNHSAPLTVTHMLSHSWAEDMQQVLEAVQTYCTDSRNKIMTDLEQAEQKPVFFFCLFALYQPEDKAGPDISQQLDMDPFGSIIRSSACSLMVVLHTTTARVYGKTLFPVFFDLDVC